MSSLLDNCLRLRDGGRKGDFGLGSSFWDEGEILFCSRAGCEALVFRGLGGPVLRRLLASEPSLARNPKRGGGSNAITGSLPGWAPAAAVGAPPIRPYMVAGRAVTVLGASTGAGGGSWKGFGTSSGELFMFLIGIVSI